LNESDELADMQEPMLQSASGDESDESEILEHDVSNCSYTILLRRIIHASA
jgi:hypothetical protein